MKKDKNKNNVIHFPSSKKKSSAENSSNNSDVVDFQVVQKRKFEEMRRSNNLAMREDSTDDLRATSTDQSQHSRSEVIGRIGQDRGGLSVVNSTQESGNESRRFIDYLLENRVLAIAALFVILLSAVISNRQLKMNQVAEGPSLARRTNAPVGRGISSIEKNGIVVGPNTSVSSRSQATDNLLAEKLAQSTDRRLASSGVKPTIYESFLYGDFSEYRKNYKVTFHPLEEYLLKLEYASYKDISTDEMFKIGKVEKFFSSYKPLFPREAKSISFRDGGERVIDKELTQRTYDLLDSNNKVIAGLKVTTSGQNNEYLYRYEIIMD